MAHKPARLSLCPGPARSLETLQVWASTAAKPRPRSSSPYRPSLSSLWDRHERWGEPTRGPPRPPPKLLIAEPKKAGPSDSPKGTPRPDGVLARPPHSP